MNKISTFIAVLALLFSGYTFFQGMGAIKRVAYVDINKVIKGYSRTNEIKEEFESQKEELNSNRDSLFQSFKSNMIDFEQNKANLSADRLVELEKLLEQKRVQLNKYNQAIQQKIQQEDVANMNLLLGDINQFLKIYGEQEGYDLILGANGSGNIMYGESAIDISEEVIQSLNL
ncbi:OmpH family outer membrane protein [Christiangramia marina]|uniref:OmpH family outer membrane protein n=1 Tax=Christiangramia marina TaxID=409436 RepID=UPI003AA8E17A